MAHAKARDVQVRPHSIYRSTRRSDDVSRSWSPMTRIAGIRCPIVVITALRAPRTADQVAAWVQRCGG
jgi:hypothetical protein